MLILMAPTGSDIICHQIVSTSNISSMYRLVQKKGTVLLSTSLAWPAVAGCTWAETFSQLSSISFAQPCTYKQTKTIYYGPTPSLNNHVRENGAP